jgi:hypothetical protein
VVHEIPVEWLSVRFAAHILLECHVPLTNLLPVGGSVWYVVRNLCCTVTTDSVLANYKTQNAFLFSVHAVFHDDCPLVEKLASTPRCLVHKKLGTDSLPIDMLPFGVPIPATVAQRSEILEGLMNYHI